MQINGFNEYIRQSEFYGRRIYPFNRDEDFLRHFGLHLRNCRHRFFEIRVYPKRSRLTGRDLFLLLAAMFAGLIRKKIVISADRIVGTNILQTRELPTANVKGCRIGQKAIVIEPDSPAYRKIIINNYTDFSDSNDLVSWLKQNFKDLNEADLEAERQRLLHDATLGVTEEDRSARITRAKWIAGVYSAIGLVGGFAGIPFDGNPMMLVLLIIYPLIGILLMATSKGLIKFLSNPRRSVYSFIYIGLFVPALVLCLGAGMGRNIYQFTNVYVPVAIAGSALTAFFYIWGINRDIPAVAGQVILMLVTAVAYSFGAIAQINCVFDKTPPAIIHTSVNDKYIEHNKGAHYYLVLNPFSAGGDQEKIEVGAYTYNKYSQGDRIDVDMKKGLFNIPWYYLHGEE